MGQGLDVGKQVLSQIRDDPLAGLLEDHCLEIGADHRKDQDARIDSHHPKKGIQGEIPYQHFFHGAHNQGRNNIVDDGKQHQQAGHCKAARIGPRIMGQAPDDLAIRNIALKAHGGFLILYQGVSQNQ